MLRPSDRAPGLLLGEGVELPDSVELGGNVVIHAGTVVGEGVRIQDGAVLGKPLALGPRSTASRDAPPPLEVGGGRHDLRRRRAWWPARASAPGP